MTWLYAVMLISVGVTAVPVIDQEPAAASEDAHHDSWEHSGKFEGDIMEPPGLMVHRNAMKDERLRWPLGQVPYEITNAFDQNDMNVILTAMKEIETQTCVRFRPRTRADVDYVTIGSDDNNPGCWSYIGKLGGAQALNLHKAGGCVYRDVAVHELLHALGLQHQQSATNRDSFVRIHWRNILAGMEDNFEKYDDSLVSDMGVPYDYGSIMHYAKDAFSRNGRPTITPLQRGVTIGLATRMSAGDIQKIKIMYGCS